jgi:hypothetical protein
MTKLDELRERYAWFEDELQAARKAGKIDSQHVRFFVSEVWPILLDENDEPILSEDGEVQYDRDANPFYFGTAQAYNFVEGTAGIPAGMTRFQLELLDETSHDHFLECVCEDLSRELANAVSSRVG